MIVEKSQPLADRIILHHTPNWWIAEFRGAVGREMAAIASADTLPTGFNGHVPGTVVCRAIAVLNPDAEVSLADAAETEPQPAPREPGPSLAAQVIAKYADQERRATLERAIKIKKGLGLMVACSYLRERGWSFEAAHQALLEAAPRKA